MVVATLNTLTHTHTHTRNSAIVPPPSCFSQASPASLRRSPSTLTLPLLTAPQRLDELSLPVSMEKKQHREEA